MPDIFSELLLGAIPHQLALWLMLMPAILVGSVGCCPTLCPLVFRLMLMPDTFSGLMLGATQLHQLALRLTLMPGIVQWAPLSAAQRPAD